MTAGSMLFELLEVLEELVELKDMKDSSSSTEEYKRRKPLAWQRARNIVKKVREYK